MLFIILQFLYIKIDNYNILNKYKLILILIFNNHQPAISNLKLILNFLIKRVSEEDNQLPY